MWSKYRNIKSLNRPLYGGLRETDEAVIWVKEFLKTIVVFGLAFLVAVAIMAITGCGSIKTSDSPSPHRPVSERPVEYSQPLNHPFLYKGRVVVVTMSKSLDMQMAVNTAKLRGREILLGLKLDSVVMEQKVFLHDNGVHWCCLLTTGERKI